MKYSLLKFFNFYNYNLLQICSLFKYIIFFNNFILQMMQNKFNQQITKYDNEDFKNLYRQVKYLNLLNQLYNSDAISRQQFQAEQNQIMSKFRRLNQHLSDQDLDSFAKLYDIQKQMKRISGYQRTSKISGDKELLSLGLTLGSKFPELQDTIHASKQTRQVKEVINILSQMTLLLAKYRKLAKRISPQLITQMQKLNKIFNEFKKKNINDQFTAMQYYEIEDTISKLWLQFSTSL